MKAKFWYSVRGKEGRLSWSKLRQLWDRHGKLAAIRRALRTAKGEARTEGEG